MMKRLAILGILAAAVLGVQTAHAWDGPVLTVKDYAAIDVIGDAAADAQLVLPPQKVEVFVNSGIFSDEWDDYSIYLADLDDNKVAFAFYGEFTDEVTNAEAATITVSLRSMKDLGSGLAPYPEADPWAYTFPMHTCEIIPHADSGYKFRCYSASADADFDEFKQGVMGLLHIDSMYITFDMGTAQSEPIWGRKFYQDMEGMELGEDSDADGVPSSIDNCPDDPNLAQLDTDGDGYGDVCDVCPNVEDPFQDDDDNDGLGDECDPCPLDSDLECTADDDDEDDDGEDSDDDGEDFESLWDSDSGDDILPEENVSEGAGCSMAAAAPAGSMAYIMIALALLPLAIKRR